MKIKAITDVIERFAPLGLQESYDNSGLIVGRPEDEVRRALIAVDVTDDGSKVHTDSVTRSSTKRRNA